MAITGLTTSQITYVQEHSLDEDALPTYYNADIKSEVAISRDFETFLILAPAGLKTAARSWIDKATTLNAQNQLRDSLLQLSYQQEAKNAGLRLAAYDSKLQNFETFREAFQTDTMFAGVPEVQKFLNDVQSVIDELSTGRERAFFDQTAANVSMSYQTGVGITTDQMEELRSWSSVFSAYLNS
jgi:hypothetical protein